MLLEYMKNISIEVKPGNIAHQNVDLLVNSSNTYLLLGSGTAEQIREAGGYLRSDDNEYRSLVNQADTNLRTVLDYIHSKRPIPSKVQKECLEYIIKNNNSKELDLGDAVLTSSGDLKDKGGAGYIAHAVGMTYDWKAQPNPPIIPATFKSVRDSLAKSFELATELECKGLAMPVMCTRKGGLTIEESSDATLQALNELNNTSIDRVVIVLYSEELEREQDRIRRFYNAIPR